MEPTTIDPTQIQALIDAINALQPALESVGNAIVSACAVVCFWLGMNSWETVAK